MLNPGLAAVVENGHNYQEELSRLHARIDTLEKELKKVPSCDTRAVVASLYGRGRYSTTCNALVQPSKPRQDHSRPDGGYTLCNATGTLCGSSSGRARNNVISIGIGEDWYFEEWLARAGCVVHAFDPTIRLRSKHENHVNYNIFGKRLFFHFAGLGADRNSSLCKVKHFGNVPCHEFAAAYARSQQVKSKPVKSGRRLAMRTSFKYGTIAGDRLLPLGELLRTASLADDEQVEVLKIDCEGCEWEAFDHIRQSSPRLLERVNQIVLELHLRTQFGLLSFGHLERMLRHLYDDHGFRVFKATPSPGFPGVLSHSKAPDDLTAAGFETDKYVAVELTMIRPSGASRRSRSKAFE